MKKSLSILGIALAAASISFCSRNETSSTTSTAASSVPDLRDVLPLQPTKIANLSFNEHVQPILSEYCYHCHGPDPSTRAPKSDPLRLDSPDYAFLERDGKPVIIKGKPEESELIRLIKASDEDIMMPPPEAHKTMKPHEIAILEQWIEEGAEYQEHWAFLPPVKAEVPEEMVGWGKSPIDYFSKKLMADHGLKPAQEQDRARLLRRVTFDLTGLPPTPDKVKSFVADSRNTDEILSEEVDRLLNTTAYAEHFTRHWLDAARYADTHGIHIDNYRAIWPYRDWVLDAFQNNMPFDQFTIEQLGGDLMPDPTLDQKVATGFNRCLPTTGEGGAIAEEYDAIYAQDRVDTTAAVWLGMTTNCASCHDHKFDPLSTKEVYQLTAFFRNTTMHAMDRNQATHPPSIFVPMDGDDERFAALHTIIAGTEGKQKEVMKKNQQEFENWLTGELDKATSIKPVKGSILEMPLNAKDKGVVDIKGHSYSIHGTPKWIAGPSDDALQFTEDGYVEVGDIGNFERNQKFSFAAWVKTDNKTNGSLIARIDPENKYRGWDLWFEKGKVGVHMVHEWPDNALKVMTQAKFPTNKWTHVAVTYNGSSKNRGVKIYINGKSERLNTEKNSLGKTIQSKVPLTLGRRSVGGALVNGAIHDFKLFNRELSANEAGDIAHEGNIRMLAKTPRNKLKGDQIETLKQHYFSTFDDEFKAITKEINQLNKEKSEIEKRGSKTLVMEEKEEAPYAHILIRGEYSNKGDKVFPDTPAILPPMTEDQPKNRLGLAQWIMDKRNPLTARVTVNRYWYYFFGRGIVESTEDFGIMGARPSHPELLDWLAVDFMENDWDLHHLVKTIVMSATYRQSAINADSREKDPDNKFLARGPRYRLDAEQIRDLALASSKLLSPKIGGKSVKPYQPTGIWESVAMRNSNTRNYTQDSGESLYRRSLYTFWKRTAPHPSMEILNAPTREIFCVRRELTNTPLQAFVVMNDPQFIEASRSLAQHAISNSSEMQQRINFISLRLISRELDASEMDVVESSFQKAYEKFKAEPEQAKKLISVGASQADENMDPAELAAWTMVASKILNLDEALCK